MNYLSFSFGALTGLCLSLPVLAQTKTFDVEPAIPLTQRIAEQFLTQLSNAKPLALSASEFDISYTMAYRSQAYLSAQQRAKIGQSIPPPAGFKAALTSVNAQKHWGVNGPIFGTLNAAHLHSPNTAFHPKPKAAYLIELELGFQLSEEVSKPFTDLASFQRYINKIIPVVEIPEIHFAGKPKPVDIIASNVGAFMVLTGEQSYDSSNFDETAFSAKLTCDGQNVSQTHSLATHAAWQHAMRLANQVIEQGQTLHPEQLLLSGDLQPSPFRMTASRCSANFTYLNSPPITYTFSIEQDSPDSVK